MRNVDGSTFLGVRATCASSLVGLLVAIGLLGPWASSPRAQAGQSGQWQTLPYTMPINPIHMALLNNGKVLVVSGSGNSPTNTNWRAAIVDLALGQVVTQQVPWDMFCNGMVTLPDGRVLINGGNLQYNPFLGERRNAVYDPATGAFAEIESMAHGRWYPTPTVLGDGRVMTFSGLLETGGTNTSVEIYTPGAGWSPESPAGWTPPLYPRMHLLPNGNVFYAGSGRGSRIFNTTTNTWSSVIANTVFASSRPYGTSVLLALSPTDNHRARVMIFGGASPATNTVEVIEPLAASPAWQGSQSIPSIGPPMSQGRIQLNATLLPSGRVLVTGGSLNDEDAGTAGLNADLFDPNVSPMTRTSAGANAYPRLYHSNALLLPDARVLLAGSNPTANYETRMEVYSPAYLFNADSTPAQRPTITGVLDDQGRPIPENPAGVIDYGSSFQVQTPDAASIGSVVLIRPGTPTHAFDMDQRMVRLSFKAGTGTLDVVAPPNGNIAPPGYYMLFVLNSAGVPSVARFVPLVTQGTIPAAPSSLTAAAASASQINLTWSDNAANETGFVIERCQGAGCSNFASLTPVGANTTSYSNTGLAASTSYSYRVAATNGAGASPYSNTASTMTPGNVPPTVSITAPANGATFTAPATVPITANAGDTDGTVTLVEFFQGTTKIGEDKAAPYSFSWPNVNAGAYTLTAKATDSAGGTTTSAAIAITVNPAGNVPPTVSITAPANGATFTAPATVPITANAGDTDGTITLVEFFQGTTKIGEDKAAPYSFSWPNVIAGAYTLTAKATDSAGGTTTSAAIAITVTSPLPGSATFIRADTTTQGNWISNYGSDGYLIANVIPSTPSYAQVSVMGAATHTWDTGTSDVRALQSPSGTGRIASQFNSVTFFTYDIRLTDDQPHWIALYLLDWDSGGFRAQTVDVLDASTNTLLDSQYVAKFSGGVYLVWEVRGHVQIRVTKDPKLGLNASVSGVFFDPASDPPSVTLTAPANGATYVAPATIVMNATASTPTGSITKVEFFRGTTSLGEDLTTPYSITWSNAPAGPYVLTAKATTSGGLTGTSTPISVTVNSAANVPPTVSITAPANGAAFTAPATVPITANAGDTDGTVTLVEFFQGTTKLGDDNAAPYGFSWPNVTAGAYTLTAKATDSAGGTTTSAAIAITVNSAANVPPTVSITAPANGATFTAPATVPITANAGDTDGTITLVEFFQGTTKIGDDNTSPYSFSWPNVIAGSYTLTAKATDSAGGTTTSAAIAITVTSPLPGSATFVRADTTTQGNWISNYGSDGYLIANVIPSTPSYAQVSVMGAATHTWDTGTSDVRALQSPSGTGRIASQFNSVTFFTYDIRLTDDQPHWIALYLLDWDSGGFRAQTVDVLDASTNTLLDSQYVAKFSGGVYLVWEVRGHVQIRVTKDPKLGLNASVSGVFFDPGSEPPSVSLTAPANNATFTAPATVPITATASDSDGTIMLVEFFQGTTKLGDDNAAPYSWSWPNVTAGAYTLTAKATDSAGGTTTSAAIAITVNPAGNVPPTVSITAPANGATFTAPATVPITANAADTDGTITLVEFFQGTTKLGDDNTAPYGFSWPNVIAGSYTLTAKATDSAGGTTTSAAIAITVNSAANVPPTVSITAPANGATFTAPATVPITATASDSDGTITLVEFFQGTTKIGEAKAAPYSLSWPNVIAGPYTLTAKATDSAGGTTTSAAIAITVNPPANVPPTVSVTAPANGATFTAPATFTIGATASDPGGSVTLVEFFQGTTKLGEDATAPYSFSWQNVPLGAYVLTARATDNLGATTTSSPVSVNVVPLTAPAAPTQLTGTALNKRRIRLNWTDNASNESGFRIERSLNGTTFTEIATRGPNTQQYNDDNLTPNTLYYYRVRAYNAAGNSAYSNVVSVLSQ